MGFLPPKMRFIPTPLPDIPGNKFYRKVISIWSDTNPDHSLNDVQKACLSLSEGGVLVYKEKSTQTFFSKSIGFLRKVNDSMHVQVRKVMKLINNRMQE